MSIESLDTVDFVESTSPDTGILIRNINQNILSLTQVGSSRTSHIPEDNVISHKNTTNAGSPVLKVNDQLMGFFNKNEKSVQNLISLGENVTLNTWKLVANISSKILYFDDEIVKVECLIDKESKIYEEREFDLDLFSDLNLEIGYLFKLCLYKRNNQQMIEVKYDSNLVSSNDFPVIDFFDPFQDLIINRKLD